MDKQIITFSANEQNLVRIGGECHYSSNKVSYIEARFDLGANWDGFDSVRAVWFTDRINGISTVLDGEGNCTVPTEVLKKKDRVFVNLVGSIVSNGELTDRLTTYPAVALVVDSKAKVDSTETAPVTPSQFEQFVSIVQDAVANIKDIVSTTLNADYTLTFVYSDGTSYTTPSIRGERGPQGADGTDGTDGNGIASAVLNSNYTLTLTFTDGTSYTTPSIRGAQGPKGDPGDVSQAQLDAAVSDLKSEINDMSEVVSSVNLYDKASTERVQNSYLNWRGEETSYTGAVISPYISVSEGDVLRWVYNPNTSNNYGSFYDGTKTFSAQIGSSSPTTETHAIDGYNKKVATVTVPSGTSYARINLNMVDDNDYNMITVNNLMPSVFVPYYKKRIVPTAIQNSLYQKTAIFNGDSICAGTVGISASDTRYGWGWAGRIGTQNDMIWHNFGIAGGTVCTDTYNYTKVGTTGIDWSQDCYIRIGSSASGTDTMYALVTQQTWDGTSPIYYRGDARHWESTDIDNMKTAYPTADYVILEACLNDGFNGVPKGVVSASYSGTFVTTTFASAMEYMLNRALSLFPKAKVGVIFPPRPDGSNAYISQLNALAESACKKWGIPYLDLYNGSGLCVNNSTQASLMYHDSTHLSQVGYDFITRKIESWMQTL